MQLQIANLASSLQTLQEVMKVVRRPYLSCFFGIPSFGFIRGEGALPETSSCELLSYPDLKQRDKQTNKNPQALTYAPRVSTV